MLSLNTNTPQEMTIKNHSGKDHIVIFPFMAKGHTIPLIHLAAALSSLRITFITTPANAPFLRRSLPVERFPDVHLIVLPFPSTPDLPQDCESTDCLPSLDFYPCFLHATTRFRPSFDAVLTHLVRSDPSPPLCLISDFFLGWTLQICRGLSLPRIVFHGMSAFSMSICKSLWVHHGSISIDGSGSDQIHVPGTPLSLRISKDDIPNTVVSTDRDFLGEAGESDVNSWGVLVNSFTDIEGEYVRLFESFYQDGARAWLVGPLCLFSDSPMDEENELIRWLDDQNDGSIVYVSFGTQAEVAEEQLDEVAHGLSTCGYSFIWTVRSDTWAPPEVFPCNGKIVKWAPQREVLNHRATGGFVSHCGWNSVMEGVSAGVPMLTWPMIADQHLNAKLVVEELRVGLRLGGSGGGGHELVRREKVSGGVRELMRGHGEVRERAEELGRRAKAAVAAGGESKKRLDDLIEELRKVHEGTKNSSSTIDINLR